jgi:hypothetical protein
VICTVEWKKIALMSHNTFTTIFVYFLPIFLFLYQNSITLYIVSFKRFISINYRFFYLFNLKIKSPHLHKNTTKNDIEEAKFEANYSFKSIFIICGYLILWAPYTIISLQRYFLNINELNIKTTIIPALIAKSTLAWPAFFNLVENKEFRDMMYGKPHKIKIEKEFNQVTVS